MFTIRCNGVLFLSTPCELFDHLSSTTGYIEIIDYNKPITRPEFIHYIKDFEGLN